MNSEIINAQIKFMHAARDAAKEESTKREERLKRIELALILLADNALDHENSWAAWADPIRKIREELFNSYTSGN